MAEELSSFFGSWKMERWMERGHTQRDNMEREHTHRDSTESCTHTQREGERTPESQQPVLEDTLLLI